jgi:hypothetical protein
MDAFALGGRCSPARLYATIEDYFRRHDEVHAEIVIRPEELADLLLCRDAAAWFCVLPGGVKTFAGIPIRVEGNDAARKFDDAVIGAYFANPGPGYRKDDPDAA